MSAKSLKPGWKMVKFGDVVRQCKESVDRDNNPFERYVEGGHMESEDIHIHRWGEFGVDYVGPAFHRIFRKRQVLYGSRRTYLKKVAVADFDGITANTTFVCETRNQDVFMQELLPFLMLTDTFTEYSIRESKGSTNPYINWPDIAKYGFPLPPLDEQKRIAEILWAADEVVEQFANASEKLQRTRETYLRGLTSNGVSKKWKVTKLSDCFEIVSSQIDPKEEPYRSMPLVAPNHIEQNTGRLICIETAKDQNAISGKYLFQPGDVVYSKIRPNLRKAFIAEFDGLCSADMYALRPLPDRIMTRFLLSILLGEHFTSFALTRSVRTGIPKLNRQELSEYKLPLPIIVEQKPISSYLESIDTEEQHLIRHRNKVVELRRQIIREHLEIAHV